jgi:hypothetical protein
MCALYAKNDMADQSIVDDGKNEAAMPVHVMGPAPEDLEICTRCNRPRGMHLYMTFRNDWYKGHEGYEVRVCAELLPQFRAGDPTNGLPFCKHGYTSCPECKNGNFA